MSVFKVKKEKKKKNINAFRLQLDSAQKMVCEKKKK